MCAVKRQKQEIREHEQITKFDMIASASQRERWVNSILEFERESGSAEGEKT